MPELLVLIPVLLVLGKAIKSSGFINRKHIPLSLITTGVVLAVLWSVTQNGTVLGSIWTGATQGILCAGGAVLAHQTYKQYAK